MTDQRRRVVLALALIAALLWTMAFMMFLAEPAEPAAVDPFAEQLQDPRGFNDPMTELQLGRNAFENCIHGTHYSAPCGADALEPMLYYHTARALWFLIYEGDAFFGRPPSIATWQDAATIVRCCYAERVDYRLAIIILLFESSLYDGAPGNPYGEVWASGRIPDYPSLEAATQAFAHNIATNYTECGGSPYLVAKKYNPDSPVYWRNVYNSFQELDRGDGSGRTL